VRIQEMTAFQVLAQCRLLALSDGSPQCNDMAAIGDSGHWPIFDITAALRGLPFADRTVSQRNENLSAKYF
jgi:hypothetical protein